MTVRLVESALPEWRGESWASPTGRELLLLPLLLLLVWLVCWVRKLTLPAWILIAGLLGNLLTLDYLRTCLNLPRRFEVFETAKPWPCAKPRIHFVPSLKWILQTRAGFVNELSPGSSNQFRRS